MSLTAVSVKHPTCDVHTHKSVAVYLGGSEFPLILALFSLQLLHFALQLLNFLYQILQENQIYILGKQYIIPTITGVTNRKSIQISGACQQPWNVCMPTHRGIKHQVQTQCSYKKSPGLDRTVVNKGNTILLKQTPQSAVINRQEKDEPRTRLEGFQTTHLPADRYLCLRETLKRITSWYMTHPPGQSRRKQT